MKPKMILLFALVLFTVIAYSQDSKSEQLYWVAETNVYYRNYTIVRFYNQENIKVHEVKIMGVNINVRSSKHRKILDQLVKEYTERAVPLADSMTAEHFTHQNERNLGNSLQSSNKKSQ